MIPIIDSISTALVGIKWEIIFVDDDSPDSAANLVTDIGGYITRPFKGKSEYLISARSANMARDSKDKSIRCIP